jgi:hypothetical protein
LLLNRTGQSRRQERYFTPAAVAAFTSERVYRQRYALSDGRIAALREVLGDGIDRATAHYRCPCALLDDDDTVTSLTEWARSHHLAEVVAFASAVEPIRDLIPRLSHQLDHAGIRLTLIQRPSDALALSFACAGYFHFWQEMSVQLCLPAVA